MTGSHANEARQLEHQMQDTLQEQSRLQAALLPGSSSRLPGVIVGVDLIEIERVAQTIERFGQRFLQRVFSPEELRESRSRLTWFAGHFAAKEACAKALGTGIGAQAAWLDMQILRQPGGKPVVRLLGDAAARAAVLGLEQVDLSITHTHHYAMAVVVGLSSPASTDSGARASTPAATNTPLE